MAKGYRAATRIKHGVENSTKWFEPGDVVTGLDKKDMADLWDAGALYEASDIDVAEKSEKKDEDPQKPASTPEAPVKTAPAKAATPSK